IALAELGGWWEGSAGRWGIDLRAMRVPTSAQLFRLAQGLSTPGAPTFGDLAASWSRDAGRVSMSATSGWRALLRGGGERPGLWASASVTTWVTPRMGVVVAAGRALEDLTRGAPEARYASLSLRVRVHGPAARIPPRTFPPSMPVVAATALAGGTKEIRVRVRGATRVEVMADFTDWMPRALRREGDNWTLVAAMPPGPHRLAVRIDGGAWQVPGNLPTVHDEFGGAFGLIAVP
ncbi:MAG: glycogen-binding domain-containing protein, partial [Gemmatimonadaceae bacterium]